MVESQPPNNPAPGLSHLRGTFVGRQREMGELKAALEDAMAGHGRLAMLVGEPGIGKTRTAQELASFAKTLGAQVLWGWCYEEEGAPPYWPWTQPLRSYIQERDPDQLRREMGPGAADIAQIVSQVWEWMSDLEPSPTLGPEQSRFRLFESITTFLKNAAQSQPLLLVLDDLQWADRSSLLLLEFLAREIPSIPLLVLGTYRDVEVSRQHPLSQSLGNLVRGQGYLRIQLSGLTQPEVEQLILMNSEVSPSPSLTETVHRRTDGNPLFVGEVIQDLGHGGTEGATALASIPEGIKVAIGRRLNRLSENCNQVLTIASVIGREFSLNLLGRLIPDQREGRLLALLEEALAAGIILESTASADSYQFTHALIQETLISELTTARKIRLHAHIGEGLEELFAADIEIYASELAYHFAQAEPVIGPEKLVSYSKMAGERALATYAWEEALAHFERGLAAKQGQPMDGETAEILFGLARAQTSTLERHRLHEAVNTVRPAFDYYVAAGVVSSALAIAEYPFRSLHERSGMAQLLAEALKLVPSDSHQAGFLLVRYGAALGTKIGDYEAAIAAFSQALTIAQRENDTELEITVFRSMASAHWMMGLNPEETLKNSLRAIALDRRVSQIQLDRFAHWEAVVALIALGDLEGAWVHTAAHLVMAEKSGDRFRIAQALHANEVLAHLQGNWETARNFSDRGLAVAHRDARLVSNRAILEYQLGDFSQGDAYLERLLDTMRLSPPGPTLDYSIAPLTIGVAARMTGVASQFDIAEVAANTALASPSSALYDQLVRTGLALMAVQRGDVAVAREQYDALRSWRITMTPLNLMCGHRVLGLLAQTMGRVDNAVSHFEESLAFCQKAGYQPEMAWTCHDYAEALLQRDHLDDRAKAMSLMDQALAISTELGMRPLTEKVTTLKEEAEGKAVQLNAPRYPVGLTAREVEVLRLIAQGKSTREIANELVLSPRTVQRHSSNLYAKINVRNRVEATAFALNEPSITPRPSHST